MNRRPVLCTFESRRAKEMAALIDKFGGTPVNAPSMKEVPLDENQPAVQCIRRLLQGGVDFLVLMTGVGTEAMLQIAESVGLRSDLLAKMADVPLLIRGPKPAAVLTKLKLPWAVKAPEPNTWEDLLTAIDDARISVDGRAVAVQEYGIANPRFYEGLRQRGATVIPMPVYRWAWPDDCEPLKDAIQRTIAGDFDSLLFTSAQQIRHVVEVAESIGRQDQWLQTARQCHVASIGPTCSEALMEFRLPVSFEASPPKMGPLVRGVMEQLQEM